MWKVLVLQIFLELVFVECAIPTILNVQKLDQKLIERKRQDTLEICRIFNENNHKLEVMNLANSFSNPKNSRRYKRNIDINNDGDRVEILVDKMYDDLAEMGEVVNYQKKTTIKAKMISTIAITNSTDKPLNNSARRFFFAPKLIQEATTSAENEDVVTEPPSISVPWPKKWKHGIVPYFIDPKTYDHQLADTIMDAFAYIEKATCIRLQKLRERPTDADSLTNVEWLYITNPSGIRQCVHSNEHKINKGVQMVVFGYDCMSLGEIVHEIMHVLGFSHEHTRPDRDEHVTILWDNIKPGYKKYFEVRALDVLMNLPYDFASVLHYPPRAFSKNGKLTIVAGPGIKLGQREGLSETDIEKIGIVYGFECVERNRQYLLETCQDTEMKILPEVIVTEEEIENYFQDKIWPFGIVNYRLRDKLEFTIEEKENIDAVIRHIDKETCIEFRDADAGKEIDEEVLTDDETIDENSVNNQSANEIDNNVVPSDQNLNEQTPEGRRNTNGSIITGHNVSKANAAAAKTPKSPARRHANNILTFVRSAEAGCRCPKPGRPNGDQVLEINQDCFNSVNDLLHMFVHLLGLDHQHNTHDRDYYIHVVWEKLTPDVKSEMEKKLPAEASLGFPYDYQSVMHYPWLQIKDGVTNIMYPIWNDGWAMGRWQGLSAIDVQKLEKLYAYQCKRRRQESGGDPK